MINTEISIKFSSPAENLNAAHENTMRMEVWEEGEGLIAIREHAFPEWASFAEAMFTMADEYAKG